MLVIFTSLLAVGQLTGVLGQCRFSVDCAENSTCSGLQDVACVCNLGSCTATGNPFFRGSECDIWSDCPCKDTPSECFCKDGLCTAEKWECHEAADCKTLEKCADKNCACTGDICEFDCDTEEDCAAKDPNNPDIFLHSCNLQTGYKCKCENSLCSFDKLPGECDTITDCVNIGKCEKDKPCACTNDQCVDPWYVSTKWYSQYPNKNCRDEEVFKGDCDYSIQQCSPGKCSCVNLEQISEYEKWGECKLKE